MITSKMNTSVKLTKLFYKYTDDKKLETNIDEQPKPSIDYEAYPPYNFSWFIKGKIAAMGWPQTVENLNYLSDVGVQRLITLSPERWPPILECPKKLQWTEVPVKEFGAPTLKQIIKFIRLCERAEITGEVLGVHCRHGRGRTGTMLACYLVHTGVAPERAVMTVRLQRPGSCETYEQEKMVCHYHDCVRGTIPKPDYRLVDDKLYFDATMRHMSDDEDDKKDGAAKKDGGQKEDGVKNEDGGKKEDSADKTEPKKKTERKKSKAMVINHKIYF